MKRNRILALVVLAMFVVSQTAFAGWGYDKEGKEGRKAGGRKADFMQSLNLTPEQQEQLSQHRQQKKEAYKEIKQSLWQKKQELKDVLKDPNFDEAKARQISGEVSGLKNQLSDLKIDGLIYTRSVLTPEQYGAFVENMKEGRSKSKRKSFFKKGVNPDKNLPKSP